MRWLTIFLYLSSMSSSSLSSEITLHRRHKKRTNANWNWKDLFSFFIHLCDISLSCKKKWLIVKRHASSTYIFYRCHFDNKNILYIYFSTCLIITTAVDSISLPMRSANVLKEWISEKINNPWLMPCRVWLSYTFLKSKALMITCVIFSMKNYQWELRGSTFILC